MKKLSSKKRNIRKTKRVKVDITNMLCKNHVNSSLHVICYENELGTNLISNNEFVGYTSRVPSADIDGDVVILNIMTSERMIYISRMPMVTIGSILKVDIYDFHMVNKFGIRKSIRKSKKKKKKPFKYTFNKHSSSDFDGDTINNIGISGVTMLGSRNPDLNIDPSDLKHVGVSSIPHDQEVDLELFITVNKNHDDGRTIEKIKDMKVTELGSRPGRIMASGSFEKLEHKEGEENE